MRRSTAPASFPKLIPKVIKRAHFCFYSLTFAFRTLSSNPPPPPPTPLSVPFPPSQGGRARASPVGGRDQGFCVLSFIQQTIYRIFLHVRSILPPCVGAYKHNWPLVSVGFAAPILSLFSSAPQTSAWITHNLQSCRPQTLAILRYACARATDRDGRPDEKVCLQVRAFVCACLCASD